MKRQTLLGFKDFNINVDKGEISIREIKIQLDTSKPVIDIDVPLILEQLANQLRKGKVKATPVH